MSGSNGKTPGYLNTTTSRLLQQQESLRRRRQYLEAEGAKPPAMRFGVDPPPVAKAYMPPPPIPGAGRQTSQSAPASARDVAHESTEPARPPMRFSLTSYPASPAVSARSHISASPTPRAVNTALTAPSSRAASKGSRTPGNPFARLESTESSVTDATGPPRGFKRQRSSSENAHPAQSLPAFPSRQVEREVSSQDRLNPQEEQPEPASGEETTAHFVPGDAESAVNEDDVAATSPILHDAEKPIPEIVDPDTITASPLRNEEEGHEVKRSPSGFPLPRSSNGVSSHFDEHVRNTVAPSALPTPPRPSSLTPLPVPSSMPVAVNDFPTPTYAPRRSLFASTPTPHKAVSRECQTAAPPLDVEVPIAASRAREKSADFGSPAPTAEQVLDSFAASDDKRCCHRPGRSATPTSADRCEPTTTSPLPADTDAAVTPSRRACGCQRTTPGSVSQTRVSARAATPKPDSPVRAASPELTPRHVLDSVVISAEKRRESARPMRTTSARTPSPIPTETRVEQSLLASAEKRVASGSPTPPWHRAPTPEPLSVAGVCGDVHEAQALTTNPTYDAAKSISPQPTPEQLIDSLTMSAQKPSHRSKATSNDAFDSTHESSPVVTAHVCDSGDVALGLAPPPMFATPASPALTPQNIEESFANCHPDSERSGAPDPVHKTASASADPADGQRSAHRSPSFGESQVKASLAVIAESAKNADRSVAEVRGSPLDTETTQRDEEMEESPSHADEVAPPMDAEAVDEEQQATFSHDCSDEEAPETSGSTTGQITTEAVTSEMFFDCHSAPPTAPPTPGLPQAYLQLQRDIEAISQGRSASHSASPAPAAQEAVARGQPSDAYTAAPAPDEYASADTKKSGSSLHDSSSPAPLSVDVTMRGSVTLLDEDVARSLTPLARGAPIQHPHQAFDEQVENQHAEEEVRELRSKVSVSRTPPPSPVPHGHSVEPAHATRTDEPRTATATSPLPRPVTLRSQIRLPHATGHVHGRGTTATTSRVADSQPLREHESPSVEPQHVDDAAQPQNTSDIIQTSEEPEVSRAITSVDQWRLNVEDDDQIFAISPSARVVVSVRHDRSTSYPPQVEITSVSRKRSRSASDAAATPADSPRMQAEVSPRQSDVLSVGTPGSEGTARSSRGSGRKSQVEQLLEMLPADVARDIVASKPSQEMDDDHEGTASSSPASTGRQSRVSTRLSTVVASEELFSVPASGQTPSVTPLSATRSAKRARRESGPAQSPSSYISPSEVQVSPLSSASSVSARGRANNRDADVSYSVVAGDVLEVSTTLPPALRQQLFAGPPQRDDVGNLSPGTRKHLRHQRKMEKQKAMKKANRAQKEASASTVVSESSSSSKQRQMSTLSSVSPSTTKKKKAKKMKKMQQAKKQAVTPVMKEPTLKLKKKKTKKQGKK